MSLAEDLRRAYDTPSHRGGAGPLRRPLAELVAQGAFAVAPPVKVEPPTPELLAPQAAIESLDVLDRASKGVVQILDRYKQLETHVKQLDAWSKAQIHAAEAAAQRWQDAAIANERKLEDLQKNIDVITRRAELAEQSLNRDKEALAFLQDRIVAAFGFGSEAHDAIEAAGLD